jgi:hypothetical protein
MDKLITIVLAVAAISIVVGTVWSWVLKRLAQRREQKPTPKSTVKITDRGPTCHYMFALTRPNIGGLGTSSAYFLVVEKLEDVPEDAKNVRPIWEGYKLTTAYDGTTCFVHCHDGERRSALGYEFAQGQDVAMSLEYAAEWVGQHPPDPD